MNNEETKVMEEATEKETINGAAAPDQEVGNTASSAPEASESTSSAEAATDAVEKVEEEKTETKEVLTTGTEEKAEISEDLKEEILAIIEEEFGLERKEKETTEKTEDQPAGFDAMVSDGLPIMAAGMMGIFVVIGIIIASVSLLAKLGSGDGYFSKGLKAAFTKKK